MPPAISECDSAQRQSRRPDLPYVVKEQRKDCTRRDLTTTRLLDDMIEQAAGARIIGLAKDMRRICHDGAEAT
jgi:hypothetical protein